MRTHKTDAQFSVDLQGSMPAVLAVAAWLERRGYSVEVPEIQERPSYEEREAYKDDGDIFATKDGVTKRVEVKGRGFPFSTRDEFPYSTPMVCSVGQWKPDQDVHFSVNESLTGALMIPKKTRPSWVIARRYDRTAGCEVDNYEVPLGLTRYVDLTK